MPPLRVAVVARAVMPLHGYGGLERHVHDLVRALGGKGVDVTLITPPPGAGWRSASSDPFDTPGIQIRHVPYVTFPFAGRRGTTVLDRSTAYPLFGYRAGRLARSMVRAGQIDIVHGLGASVLGYALARDRERAPLVFNPQGLEEFGGSAPRQAALKRLGYAPLRAAVRICARHADRIIATDRALVPVVERHLHPRPSQLCVIPNAIDLVAVDALSGASAGDLIRQRHGVPLDELVILSVGRLEENKGFVSLVDALGRASQPGCALASRPWRWVVIGTGPFERAIVEAATVQGIAAQTHLIGRTTDTDLHAWYEGAALFVHPTLYEGSSLVTLEAMAHRKAIVATRAGGVPDKVRPGVNGWLVDPGDPAALARAIDEAIADPARLAAMGQESRAIVEREFSWAAIIEQQLACYRELLPHTKGRLT